MSVGTALSTSTSIANAQQFTNFRFAEQGFKGEIIVLNERDQGYPVKPVAVSVLSGNVKTQHVCELRALENTAARISTKNSLAVTMQVVDGNTPTGETFEIVFAKNIAIITYQEVMGKCGQTAHFRGRWQRTPK